MRTELALLLLLLGCSGPDAEVRSAPCVPAMDGAPAPTDLATLESLFASARAVVPALDGVSVTLTPAESETDFFFSNLDLTTLTAPPRERSYLAFYNSRLFEAPPSGPATVAILVHELAHVVDYTEMSSQELAEFGVWYATQDVAAYEHDTDLFAMERGCAPGLIGYREWLYDRIPADAVDEKKRVYYTPDEIRTWMIAGG